MRAIAACSDANTTAVGSPDTASSAKAGGIPPLRTDRARQPRRVDQKANLMTQPSQYNRQRRAPAPAAYDRDSLHDRLFNSSAVTQNEGRKAKGEGRPERSPWLGHL